MELKTEGYRSCKYRESVFADSLNIAAKQADSMERTVVKSTSRVSALYRVCNYLKNKAQLQDGEDLLGIY